MARGRKENLIPFDQRSEEEAREFGRKGGKASGEARRRKANFRKTLNALLTAKIDSPEWTPALEALGFESTFEAAVNAAMIQEALSGNVKAYVAIRDTIGQTVKSETDLEEQKMRMEAVKAKSGVGAEEDEAYDDGFVDALKGAATQDWSEEVGDEHETSGV